MCVVVMRLQTYHLPPPASTPRDQPHDPRISSIAGDIRDISDPSGRDASSKITVIV